MTAKPPAEPWPLELRLKDKGRLLHVAFEDGRSFDLSAEFLRIASPSAEVQGHSPSERKILGGKKDVAVLAVVPVGNYAVRLQFDDMHDTGIYSWGYLYGLGAGAAEKWAVYLDELAARGLKRER